MGAKAKYKLAALLLCFAAVVCGVSAALYISAVRLTYPVKYETLIEKYSTEYGVPQNLLLAVIKTESSFDPTAVSSAGALGLTQITPETFSWLQTKTGESLDAEQLQDEETAIKYGALFLGLLLDEFENTETAAKYCRAVYEAGFSPVCPPLFLPLFLADSIPQEHKDGIDIARDFLRRAHVLVVCSDTVDEAMKNDIAIAERLRITATTLDGILTVKGQGREKGGSRHERG